VIPLWTPAPAPPPVVGGEPLEQGARPEVAAVYFDDAVGCTGVLVAPQVVLTAGHCQAASSVKLDAADYAGGEGITVAVERAEVYPEPDDTLDLAALVLAAPVDIAPAPLALGCVLEQGLYDGAAVALVGYGATDRDGNVSTTALHEAAAEVVDADCVAIERGCREAVSPGGELIAVGEGTDTCVGDSGGPVYLQTPWGGFVVGLTSRAVLDGTAYCEGGGIYTRPDAALEWIEAITGPLAVPDCPGDTGLSDSGAADSGATGGGKPRGCGCGGEGPAGPLLPALLGLALRSLALRRRSAPGRWR
jgi:secreted trypsin-like serine protease